MSNENQNRKGMSTSLSDRKSKKSALKSSNAQKADKSRVSSKMSAVITKPPRAIQHSFKLGETKDPRKPFLLKMRMPDWHTDADEDPNTQERLDLFPEEALGKNKIGAIPYLISNFDVHAAPSPNGWLGGKVLPPDFESPGVPKATFNTLIFELAKCARNYNSTLYLYRLYHFASDYGNAQPHTNPNGPKRGGLPFPPPNPNDPNFDKYAQEIEARWKSAAKELDQLLDPSETEQSYSYTVFADMVQVNGFIISMRVVAVPAGPGKRFLEISGSSSHVSIDYPFSST